MTWGEIKEKLEKMGLDSEQSKQICELIKDVVDDYASDLYWRDWDFGG